MQISRRQFLIGGLMAAAAAAGAIVITLPKQGAGSSGSGKAAHEEFTYRGKAVTIDETASKLTVTINGQAQPMYVKLVPSRGRPYYASHLLPFENFDDPVTLIKQTVDDALDLELFILP